MTNGLTGGQQEELRTNILTGSGGVGSGGNTAKNQELLIKQQQAAEVKAAAAAAKAYKAQESEIAKWQKQYAAAEGHHNAALDEVAKFSTEAQTTQANITTYQTEIATAQQQINSATPGSAAQIAATKVVSQATTKLASAQKAYTTAIGHVNDYQAKITSFQQVMNNVAAELAAIGAPTTK